MLLHNNCRCSKLSVHPKDWKTVRASTKKDWYITYRFYDPTVTDIKTGKVKPKLITIKGMNTFKDVLQRRTITQNLLDNELDLLLNKAYNPITKQFSHIEQTEYEIDPHTPFITALQLALEKIKCEKCTKEDIKSVLKYFEIAAIQLRFDKLQISQVKRKHIKLTLNHCEKVKEKWSANQFNHYRKYLSILFTELCELDAVEYNPIRDLSKQKTITKIRETLSTEDRIKVDAHLKNNHYNLWRFMHIFFHSGARESELVALKGVDVDLKKQRYKVIIKKGKTHRQVYKTIKDIALPLWTEIMQHCKADDFVFGLGLEANIKPTTNHLISKYWLKYVKKPLGITADFYSLKHSNTTETVNILSDEDAAKMNGHTSTAMVVSIYDVGRKDRVHDRLKGVCNSFI